MGELPSVVVVIARCSRNKQWWGIRFEEKLPGRWTADWAFVIKEAVARREGYDRGKITGVFVLDAAYPGCPHCGAMSVFKCRCGKVACWDGERYTVTCPWCGATLKLSGQIESLSAGRDR
ncbi:MAG: hypothetical protein FJ005_08645 [Chloroflexi bacterium]|nr:hypothetical protein [Chloroflexota bacterium]